MGNLELARELSGQMAKLVGDEAKEKKKQVKREMQERNRSELVKVRGP